MSESPFMLEIEINDTLEIETDENTRLVQQAKIGKSLRHESSFVSGAIEPRFVMKRTVEPRKKLSPTEIVQLCFAAGLGLSIGLAAFLFQLH